MNSKIEPDFLQYVVKPVNLQPSDLRYPDVFARIRDLLQPHFPGKEFVHFGSTAVPGLRGKGFIDIFILTQPEEFEQCLKTLESLGFQFPSYAPQPLPAHRPFRIAAIRHGDSVYKIHVHLTPPNSEDHKNALRFVEALRQSPELRAQYEKTKEDAVLKGFTAPTEYNRQKDHFLQKFLRGNDETRT